MKICSKRIRCPDCQRLVTGQERKIDNRIQVACSRCGRPIWLWNGIFWRYITRPDEPEMWSQAADEQP